MTQWPFFMWIRDIWETVSNNICSVFYMKNRKQTWLILNILHIPNDSLLFVSQDLNSVNCIFIMIAVPRRLQQTYSNWKINHVKVKKKKKKWPYSKLLTVQLVWTFIRPFSLNFYQPTWFELLWDSMSKLLREILVSAFLMSTVKLWNDCWIIFEHIYILWMSFILLIYSKLSLKAFEMRNASFYCVQNCCFYVQILKLQNFHFLIYNSIFLPVFTYISLWCC